MTFTASCSVCSTVLLLCFATSNVAIFFEAKEGSAPWHHAQQAIVAAAALLSGTSIGLYWLFRWSAFAPVSCIVVFATEILVAWANNGCMLGADASGIWWLPLAFAVFCTTDTVSLRFGVCFTGSCFISFLTLTTLSHSSLSTCGSVSPFHGRRFSDLVNVATICPTLMLLVLWNGRRENQKNVTERDNAIERRNRVLQKFIPSDIIISPEECISVKYAFITLGELELANFVSVTKKKPSEIEKIVNEYVAMVDSCLRSALKVRKIANVGDLYIVCSKLSPHFEEGDSLDMDGAMQGAESLLHMFLDVRRMSAHLQEKISVRAGVSSSSAVLSLSKSEISSFTIHGSCSGVARSLRISAKPDELLVANDTVHLLEDTGFKFEAPRDFGDGLVARDVFGEMWISPRSYLKDEKSIISVHMSHCQSASVFASDDDEPNSNPLHRPQSLTKLMRNAPPAIPSSASPPGSDFGDESSNAPFVLTRSGRRGSIDSQSSDNFATKYYSFQFKDTVLESEWRRHTCVNMCNKFLSSGFLCFVCFWELLGLVSLAFEGHPPMLFVMCYRLGLTVIYLVSVKTSRLCHSSDIWSALLLVPLVVFGASFLVGGLHLQYLSRDNWNQNLGHSIHTTVGMCAFIWLSSWMFLSVFVVGTAFALQSIFVLVIADGGLSCVTIPAVPICIVLIIIGVQERHDRWDYILAWRMMRFGHTLEMPEFVTVKDVQKSLHWRAFQLLIDRIRFFRAFIPMHMLAEESVSPSNDARSPSEMEFETPDSRKQSVLSGTPAANSSATHLLRRLSGVGTSDRRASSHSVSQSSPFPKKKETLSSKICTVIVIEIPDHKELTKMINEKQVEISIICASFIKALGMSISQNGGVLERISHLRALASFNAHSFCPDHPIKACRAVLQFRNLFDEHCIPLAETLGPEKTKHVDFRASVHTGTAFSNAFPLNDKFSTQVLLGEILWEADTICSHVRKPSRMLVSHTTFAKVKYNFVMRSIDIMFTDGKQSRVYELVRPLSVEESGEEWMYHVQKIEESNPYRNYENAFECFVKGELNKAQENLDKFNLENPGDAQAKRLDSLVKKASFMVNNASSSPRNTDGNLGLLPSNSKGVKWIMEEPTDDNSDSNSSSGEPEFSQFPIREINFVATTGPRNT